MKGDLKMNKRELIDTVAANAEITKKEADAVVNATLDAIIDGLAKEGKVVIPGFGSFEVRNKTAREGRNPRTGEKVKIAAKRAPAFKPGKAMKDAVEKKYGDRGICYILFPQLWSAARERAKSPTS